MVNYLRYICLGLAILMLSVETAWTQQAGSIRGVVYDKDFESPLAAANVLISEMDVSVITSEEGNYVFGEIEPGTYTLIFSKDGFTTQIKADIVVSGGQLSEIDIWLTGEFTEMEEFIVQDIQIGSGSEEALLQLRLDSPALMDSISSELMSRAGASDAAGALKLVSGATVQDGKFAVVRGLPDRYVNSQLNNVRLPTSDEDKRAVQLDQFPSAAIESVQVSKTFTPDQQGDASGGAVNIVLKSIPEESIFKISGQSGYNLNVVENRNEFLTSRGGGVNTWGKDDGRRDMQPNGQNWNGPFGVQEGEAPEDYKWSVSAGGKTFLDRYERVKIGAFGSFFYERDSSYFEDGIDDKYWVENLAFTGGERRIVPEYSRGSPQEESFLTSLFDVTQGAEEVKWGGLGTVGIETKDHQFDVTYMFTRVAEDKATLLEDTRGKKTLAKFFPDNFNPDFFSNYDPKDPDHPGNSEAADAAPYLRQETLQYTERTTQTLQFRGKHKLGELDLSIGELITFLRPEFDWGISHNKADMDQPDKRQFGTEWRPFAGLNAEPTHLRLKPGASFTLGNVQRIWKDISEDGDQQYFNIKLPFQLWNDQEGYAKFGWFNDQVSREYNQDSFSNFSDVGAQYVGPFSDLWSEVFEDEDHPISAASVDVDYDGEQKINAWYYMLDMPISSNFNIIGGARYEDTEINIENFPDPGGQVLWIPPNASAPQILNPGDADVAFEQSDVLPSLGFVYDISDQFKLRGSYSETVARQTFKELSPIQQQEFLGGDIFIGNPNLKMSSLKNYDIRLDYTPYNGGLISFSYFYKDIEDPIEYVRRIVGFSFTTPVNYPKGEINGFEIEARQKLGHFSKELKGLMIGANATFIDSEVTLPASEAAQFNQFSVQSPRKTRDMTNAPEHLYNLFMTYDVPNTGTQLAVFYTVRGDTLIAGAGQKGQLVPNVYESEYGTLNASITQKLNKSWTLKLQAKNLLDPAIETIYRPIDISGDTTKTSYKKGIEFSVSLSGSF